MNPSALTSAEHPFKRAGASIEQAVRKFRSYLLPSHLWTYWRVVRQHASTAEVVGRPFVFFDFTRVEIDNETGRYVFALVREFEALGFQICYRNNFRFLATMRHKLFKRMLLERPFHVCDSMDELPPDSVAVVVTDRSRFPEGPGCRQIRIRYDEGWPRTDQEVAMTYFVHPWVYEEWLACPAPDLAVERSWRVFFAGKMADEKYSADKLHVKFGKMSRCEMLRTLETALPADRLLRLETLDPPVLPQPAFVWADTARYQIPRKQWLNVMTRADFFLACPGMDMPLCHNLIEALSRGTVPILEYPEFLEPPLEHNVNCLVFHGRDSLLKTFDQIFELSQQDIGRLRKGAYAYFQKHLAAGEFARRLLNSPHRQLELLLNAYRAPRRNSV